VHLPRMSIRSTLILAAFVGAAACDRPVTDPGTGTPVPQFHGDGEHSHGRYSHISWEPRPDIGTYAVEFTYQAAFRRGYSTCYQWTGSGFATTSCTGLGGRAGTGDIIRETIAPGGSALKFGDGTSTGVLHFLVTSTNASATTIEDWIFVVALDPATGAPNIVKNYAGAGPYTADNYDCCRIDGLRNSGDNYGVQTLVTPGTGARSALSNLPPIVNVPQGGVRTWNVPTTSPDGRTLRWSLSNPATTVGGAQPAGMSIDANTGVVSWNTDGRTLGYYWSNVTIEELAGAVVVGRVAVDYLVRLVAAGTANDPPYFTAPAFCGSSTSGTVGQPISFAVTTADPNAADVVTLVASGVPAGATFNPPAPANPISALFSWTPATTGPRVITFIATDPHGAQALCPVTINVQQPSLIAHPGGPYTGGEGAAVAFDGSGSSDPLGGTLQYEWDFGDGNTGTGVSPSHTYADNGLYEVKLTVTADGRTAVATTSASISNVAPLVNVGADRTIDSGSSFQLEVKFSDPGVLDAPWSWLVDWGNGSQSVGSTSDASSPISVQSPTFTTPGKYTVLAQVTDKDGGVGSDNLTLTVRSITDGPGDGTSVYACTPGFWSQNGLRRGAWPAGYAPAAPVSSIFADAAGYLGSATLLDALTGYRAQRTRRNTFEGAVEILLRAGVAAVLNQEVFGDDYAASSVASIQQQVSEALGGSRAAVIELAGTFDSWNNSGSCPSPARQ
jgi:PKD repeat protein